MSQMGSGDIKVQIGVMSDGVTHGGTQNEQKAYSEVHGNHNGFAT